MTDGLVVWLRAVLDDVERIARAAEGDPLFDGTGIVDAKFTEGTRRVALPSHLAIFVAGHDPAWVLRDIAAKRRIIERCVESIQQWREGRHDSDDRDQHIDEMADMLRLLASSFADLPGWREEWAPPAV